MTLTEMMTEALQLSIREHAPEYRAGAAIAKDAHYFRAVLNLHAFRACKRHNLAELFNKPDFGPFLDKMHVVADEAVKAALDHFIKATSSQ